MIRTKVTTIVNTTVDDILVKPAACNNEIVNFIDNLIWWVLFNGTYYLKTRCLTDKQRLMKNSWNRRPLSFTTRFSIILFLEETSSWRGGIEISKTDDFSGIFTFELFIQFTGENVFWWIKILFSRCITTNNS